MREHIRILGILNMVMGGFIALIGIVILIVVGGASNLIAASLAANDPDMASAAPLIAAIGMGAAIFFLILAAPAMIGGWGLLHFRPWSRVFMIVLSILHLFHIPFGTALGVYGLWVLFSDESRRILETGGQGFQPLPGGYAPHLASPRPTYPPQPPPAV